MSEFQGFHALITGSSRGIGFAIAQLFLEKGADVTLCGKDSERLAAAKARLGVKDALCFDATNFNEMRAATANIPPVHFLINNAGAAISAPFLKTTDADLSQMLNVNLASPFLLTQALLPQMLEAAKLQRVRIINIASTAGVIGYPYVSAYVAAKHAMIGFTKSLAIELAGKNITVNAIAPGFTETALIDDAVAKIQRVTGRSESAARETLAHANPMKRLVLPQDIAKAAAFLCARDSDMINGHTLMIDGGEVIT